MDVLINKSQIITLHIIDAALFVTRFKMVAYIVVGSGRWEQLEQLERLRSEDTPYCLMIIQSYWIPSQKKMKSKLQI